MAATAPEPNRPSAASRPKRPRPRPASPKRRRSLTYTFRSPCRWPPRKPRPSGRRATPGGKTPRPSQRAAAPPQPITGPGEHAQDSRPRRKRRAGLRHRRRCSWSPWPCMLGLMLTWLAYRERRRRWTTTERRSPKQPTPGRWQAIPEPAVRLGCRPPARTPNPQPDRSTGGTHRALRPSTKPAWPPNPNTPHDPESWFRHALHLQQQGHAKAAATAYHRADKLGHGAAAANLGVLHEQQGNHPAAEDCYRRADQRGNPDGAFNLAVALEEQNQLATAAAAYKRADQRGHPKAAANLGVLLEAQGDLRGSRGLLPTRRPTRRPQRHLQPRRHPPRSRRPDRRPTRLPTRQPTRRCPGLRHGPSRSPRARSPTTTRRRHHHPSSQPHPHLTPHTKPNPWAPPNQAHQQSTRPQPRRQPQPHVRGAHNPPSTPDPQGNKTAAPAKHDKPAQAQTAVTIHSTHTQNTPDVQASARSGTKYTIRRKRIAKNRDRRSVR